MTFTYTGPGTAGTGGPLNDNERNYVANAIIGAAHTTIGKNEIVVVGLKNDFLAVGIVSLPAPLTGADTDRAIIASALNVANTKKMTKVEPGRPLDDSDILDIAKETLEDFRKQIPTIDGKSIFLLDSSSGNSFCVALRDKPGTGPMRAPDLPVYTP